MDIVDYAVGHPKKTFKEEWTGERDRAHFDALKAALASTVPGVLATLK